MNPGNPLAIDPDERLSTNIDYMLILSLNHLPPEDVDAIRAAGSGARRSEIWSREYGVLLHRRNLGMLRITKPMREVFKLAERHGCDWIMLDCDAEIHPGLKYWIR